MSGPSEVLQKACRLGDIAMVRKALEQAAAHVNALDSKLGWSPLYRAVICGHYDAAQLLLSKGADPNLRTKAGEVPLHPASDTGNCKLVQLLLDHSADPNLLSKGDLHTDGESPLLRAVRKENHRLAWLLLRNGAEVDAVDAVLGQTPLHIAAAKGNAKLVQMLIAANARKDIQDKQGLRPVDIAESCDIREMLRVVVTPEPSERLKSDSPLVSEADFTRSIAVERGEDITFTVPAMEVEPGPRYSVVIQRTPEAQGSGLLTPDAYTQSDMHIGPHFAQIANPLTPDAHEAPPPTSPEPESTSSLSTSVSIPADYKKSTLYLWLSSLRLHPLFEPLLEQGYGDVESLVEAVQAGHLTLDTLQKYGVDKIGWRMRLMACLEEEAKGRPISPQAPDLPPLSIWLDNLRLSSLYPHFQAVGLDDLEHLIALMHTRYAPNDHLLETYLGITQLASRHRILLKLYDDAEIVQSMLLIPRNKTGWRVCDREMTKTACEMCGIM